MSIKKIVVIGPESTGKSTLSEWLAKQFDTIFAPEYARQYLTYLGRAYEENDLLEIAQGQISIEDEFVKDANKILFCDTDLHVIKVWSEHKYHHCNKWILEEIARRKYDYYLLTNLDMPWEDDPLREHGTTEMRNYFYQQYFDIVINSGVSFGIVTGVGEARTKKAFSLITQNIQHS